MTANERRRGFDKVPPPTRFAVKGMTDLNVLDRNGETKTKPTQMVAALTINGRRIREQV